ncbi:MAG: DMT family transporter [Syntrophomonas sp.]|nr:DMT family transporter [Syntrophomonas sp.]
MSILKANFLLLLTAAIWGFAFVAQRVGMDYLGPFTFNGIRFLLGSISLIPLLLFFRSDSRTSRTEFKYEIKAGICVGLILFMASSLQQIGLIYTTAGKAAFITSLYIVLVPLLGIFLGQSAGKWTWIGCMLSVTGLYFLCIKEYASIQLGDLFQLTGALFWALHILIIGYFAPKVDTLKLSFYQFITCSVLSLIIAVITETIVINDILAASVPIIYGGVFSVGIAYTLQVLGQKHSPPAHAAIIMSLEAVFAVIGGFLILNERIVGQEILGCILMLSGMLVSQMQSLHKPQIMESVSPQPKT